MPNAPPSSAASPQIVAQPHPRSECACHRAQRSMAAYRIEAVMLRDNRPKRDCGTGNSRKRVNLELLSCIQRGVRIVLAVGLVAGCEWHALGASTNPAPAALTVQRSTRVFPHKFTVHPDGATVAANQTQRFEVTDAQGNAVAVHWNVSGLDCSGMACGTIDSDGVYRTPSALPHPQVIILEGVLDSNPNYSVLTQVELVPAATASGNSSGSPALAQAAPAKTQAMPRLAEQQNLARGRNTVVPPLPNAIAAAPVVAPVLGPQTIARASLSPPPNVTRPMPVIEASNVAPEHSYSLPPLPTAIAAAPMVERQITGRASQPPPTPNATAPLPVIETGHAAPTHSYSLPPLPTAVAAAPIAEKQIIARTPPPPQPNVTAPPRVAGGESTSPSQSSPL